MSSQPDIIRYIDTIARDREIDPEGLYASVEQSLAQALAKKYGIEDLELSLDRESGQLVCNYEVDLETEGRILAQSVKQAIISRVREAERDVLYIEFERRIGEIVTGSIQRFEGDAVIINLGRNMEGILPRTEKVRGESYNIGDRIRAMVLEVKKAGPRVKVILTRAHKDLVRALFELEVPEIAEGIIEIRRIEREPGYRTKLAVHSSDDKVDCVGACVGVRGTRIKSIIDELNGERIDIIRWNQDPEALIVNALKPAEISHITLDEGSRKALVLVDEDQLSLAIGRKGQNVRLASRLTAWEIDIMTRAELEKVVEEEAAAESAAPDAEVGEDGPEAGENGDLAVATPDGAPDPAAAPLDAPPETPEADGTPAGENMDPTDARGAQETDAAAGETGEPDAAPDGDGTDR
ncbi:MAG: transcription termination factor NusA [Planctomycetota bacterium]